MVATRIAKRAEGGEDAGAPRFGFEFHSPDRAAPEDVVRYTEDKVAARLQKYGHRLVAVVVHIREVNGTRHGEGTVCHMEARLARLEPVNVEETDDDLREAIDLALDRLEVAVARHVKRARRLPRKEGRRAVRDRKLTV